MMARTFIAPMLLSLLAGLGGAIAGQRLTAPQSTPAMHDRLHGTLSLNSAQDQHIHQLEVAFAAQRASHEARIRAADASLAAAMVREGRYGPDVAAAVDDVHSAMGALQKASIDHMFAMRAVLDPQQQTKFDRIIAESLTDQPAQ
jgi:Spy/CpxP family protein refolding chaperone